MYQTGGFWADSSGRREHCYKVIPKDIIPGKKKITTHEFDRVYQSLGKLGYRFRDAGHSFDYAIISLDREIRPKHLKRLEDTLSIESNDGTELSCI